MDSKLIEIFEDNSLVIKIRRKIPELFYLAELESSRAGKIGMQVGSLRESIIIALLIYKFGSLNVKTNIPITEPEVDVLVYESPVSIKTITSRNFSGVKLVWTVDAIKSQQFLSNYSPTCDIILIQIVWGSMGGFFLIPLEAQEDIFQKIGKSQYIKLPKPGTNPRGVEFSRVALELLIKHHLTRIIEIEWKKPSISYDQYKRWIEYWERD
jgi:hypothetical protein